MRKPFKLKKIALLLTLAVILGSCKAQKMTSDQLKAQEYTITQLGDKDVSDSKLTLKVMPEKSIISGYSGCNNYNFNYELENGKLDLGYASATKMYCEEDMAIENLFFQKAASVTQFENSEEVINFKNKEGEIVIKGKKKD